MSDIKATDSAGVARVTLDAETGTITAGGGGKAGSVSLVDKSGKPRVRIAAGATPATGPHGVTGPASATTTPSGVAWEPPAESLTLDGGLAVAIVGGRDIAGRGYVTNRKGQPTIEMNGESGLVLLGGIVVRGDDGGGHIELAGKSHHSTIRIDGTAADLHVGGKGAAGNLFVYDGAGAVTVEIDGKRGDVILTKADCAEDFDVAAATEVEPGTVVVLDDNGAVFPCTQSYDGRVAGVVSGAGTYRPALVLDRQIGTTARRPVALMGKVFCKVDAAYGAVRAGDLLTTSATIGHAMKATDRSRAFGAVLGKALGALDAGRALVPILVTLQ